MARSLVIADLARWGPDANAASLSLQESRSYCRSLATAQYENFPVLTWAVPAKLRQPFSDIYAFCRWADDLGDEAGSPERALALLKWWGTELDRCYAGEAQHPVFIALRPTISEFTIPRQPFDDLISAFIQDQTVREYGTRDQLLDYCTRSANPVGRLVLRLCGRDTPQNLPLSDAICTGLQLTNFWQDVSRDLDIGRVYLPRDDRERFGYTPEDLRNRITNPAFLELMREEVAWARNLLNEGRPLAARMPGRLRVETDLFARGGLLILKGIERINFRVWDQRPVVRKSQLAWECFKSLVRMR